MVFEAGGEGCIFNDNGDDASDNIFDDMDTDFFASEDLPNPAAHGFYDLMNAADQPLWPGCDQHSILSASFRMFE